MSGLIRGFLSGSGSDRADGGDRRKQGSGFSGHMSKSTLTPAPKGFRDSLDQVQQGLGLITESFLSVSVLDVWLAKAALTFSILTSAGVFRTLHSF